MKFSILKKQILFVLLILTFKVTATIIVPFPNLGEMAKETEAVVLVKALKNYEVSTGNEIRFRTQLQVLETVKGDLKPNDLFDIQHWHLKIGDLERTVWGDLELTEGENYFLFLNYGANGFWQPSMLSYAAFQETDKNGEKVLVPIGLGAEVHILNTANGLPAEPLKTYYTRDLIAHLTTVLIGGKSWDKEKVETEHSIDFFNNVIPRNTNPGHCTHLSGSPYARWPDFDVSSLPVWYGSDANGNGDPGCGNEDVQVQNAISDMTAQYQGINLSDGGTHTFIPGCSGQGAADNEFITWVSANLGGTRHLVIQFDDPCSEIADLSGCSGTLAIGGLYWYSSTHTYCGASWRNAAYGYIIVNNGTGACQCSNTDYQIMLTHEMSHSLNVGHISGSGTANMNPSCCTTIQTLDIQCLDYMYDPAALPVEIVHFEGKLEESRVKLNWQTASEISNDYFTVERSFDGIFFEKVAQITGSGDIHFAQNYTFVDDTPQFGNNYYRLSQTDFDGTTEVLERVVTIEFFDNEQMTLLPNPVSGSEIRLVYQSRRTGDFQVEIYNVAGKMIKRFELESSSPEEFFDLNISELNSGVFYAKIIQQRKSQSLRFLKTN